MSFRLTLLALAIPVVLAVPGTAAGASQRALDRLPQRYERVARDAAQAAPSHADAQTRPGAGLASQAPTAVGSVLSWGCGGGNNFGQCAVPAAASNGVSAVSAGGYHSLALKGAGVLAWGCGGGANYGQCAVPSTASSDVTAIAAGGFHSLALKGGGLLAWGCSGVNFGQCTVPAAATSGVVAISAGVFHSLALKSDGSVVAWGCSGTDSGQCTIPAAATSSVAAIAAGHFQSLALKAGAVLAWGCSSNNFGQCSVPAVATSGVGALAAGSYHSLALKSGGVLAWGCGGVGNDYGQCSVPAGAGSGVSAIAASFYHSLALKSSGSVLAWGCAGSANFAQCTVPAAATSGVVAIAGGFSHSLALRSTPGVKLYLAGQDHTGTNFLVTVNSASFDGGGAPAQSAVPITGLQPNTAVTELDCRPATGQLYGIGYRFDPSLSSQLYRIDKSTGAATQVGPSLVVTGPNYGFDVDPVADQIRFTGQDGTNRRLNPVTGGVGTDTSLSYAAGDPNAGRAPNVFAIAYPPGGTTVYGFDSTTHAFVRSTAPGTGSLTTVGTTIPPLRPNDSHASFDIAPNGEAWALFYTFDNPFTTPYIVSVNLSTGEATHVAYPPTEYLTSALTADCGTPTAARVVGFSATRLRSGVLLRWTTASEADSLGFNVYAARRGTWVRVNRGVAPAVGFGPSSGRRYRLVVQGPLASRPASYRLELVGLDGSRSWVGQARPGGWAPEVVRR